MILVIDNHGFTTNILCHQLGAVDIVTAAELAALDLEHYTHVVVTHGTTVADLSPLRAVPQLPVLAIGSGYQDLAVAYGHQAIIAPAQPVYGQPVLHQHTASGLFAGLPNPTPLTTYHAWRLTAMDPARFAVHAVDRDEAVLTYHVVGTHHWGIHADPAALQSTHGKTLIENFLALAPSRGDTPPLAAAQVSAPQSVACFTRQIHGVLDTAATFTALQRDSSAAFWLDSAAAHLGQGDTTIMGTNAGPLAHTVRWNVETQQLQILQHGHETTTTQSVFDYLQAHAWRPADPMELDGFSGGWVGYLGYEAKQATLAGHRNRWQATTPDAYWIKPQSFLRYDHTAQLTTLFAYEDAALLDAAEAALVFGSSTSVPADVERRELPGTWRLSSAEYEHRVSQIRDMLRAGQAAGICLTDTYTLPEYTGDGLQLYRRLRKTNPAPYAGYLRFTTFGDTLEVLSASPEKFLSVDATGRVESKPIKGTVARSDDPAEDAWIAQQMAADPKIQSENLMITDLLRDDLAQVTRPGSVAVPKLMTVETFATVHQLVTTVTGQLRDQTSALDALRAVFPGGSMTGAPKRVSVKTLENLEAGPRGIYSGAMGWIGDNNTAEFSVVIRTMVLDAGQLTIGAGGAVVVDSDPTAEELEKHLKAKALFDSIAEQL